jgi:hypothetical protein
MRPPILALLLLACLACVGAASAQRPELVFAGMPWRAPADSVRAQLASRGFAFRGADEHGDLVFARADGFLLSAELQAGRTVGFMLVDTTRGRRVDERYRALADSLAAALGKPDTVSDEFELWCAGLTTMGVDSYYRDGIHHVQLVWRGPGWFDEMDRRGRLLPGLASPPPGYTIVSANFISRVAVDTATLARRPDGTLHGRFRIDYVHPVGSDVDPFDVAAYEMDFDCAAKRTRLVGRTLVLRGETRDVETHDRPAWETPQPGGHHERGLDAVCRAASHLGNAVATRP